METSGPRGQLQAILPSIGTTCTTRTAPLELHSMAQQLNQTAHNPSSAEGLQPLHHVSPHERPRESNTLLFSYA